MSSPDEKPSPRLRHATTLMIAIGTLLAGVGAVLALFITNERNNPSDNPATTDVAGATTPSGGGKATTSPARTTATTIGPPAGPNEIRTPVSSGTEEIWVDVYPNVLDVDPSSSAADIDLTERTIDATNTAQFAVMPADLGRLPIFGDCANVPAAAWVSTIRIQDIKLDVRFCIRSSSGRLGYLSMQAIRYDDAERTRIRAITFHWEVWPA